jgi:hypothetical protein
MAGEPKIKGSFEKSMPRCGNFFLAMQQGQREKPYAGESKLWEQCKITAPHRNIGGEMTANFYFFPLG